MNNMRLPESGMREEILVREAGGREELHLVTFSLGERYGVDIAQVQEIIRVGNITVVPNCPSYMDGVINLRGKILPVLNLRRKLGIAGAGVTKNSRIVVTEVNGKLLGLLVDSVSHVIKVSAEVVESTPEEVLEADTDYITGVCKLPERIIILLDLERLLRKEKIKMEEDAYGRA